MLRKTSLAIFIAVLMCVFNNCSKHGTQSKDGESVSSSLKIGDIITFGHYEQDDNTSNGKEPIEWRVLDINGLGHILVISDKVLDVQPYNTTWISRKRVRFVRGSTATSLRIIRMVSAIRATTLSTQRLQPKKRQKSLRLTSQLTPIRVMVQIQAMRRRIRYSCSAS